MCWFTLQHGAINRVIQCPTPKRMNWKCGLDQANGWMRFQDSITNLVRWQGCQPGWLKRWGSGRMEAFVHGPFKPRHIYHISVIC